VKISGEVAQKLEGRVGGQGWSCIVRLHYQAVTSKDTLDWEDWAIAIVTFRACRPMCDNYLQLWVFKCSINRALNSNLLSRQCKQSFIQHWCMYLWFISRVSSVYSRRFISYCRHSGSHIQLLCFYFTHPTTRITTPKSEIFFQDITTQNSSTLHYICNSDIRKSIFI
jgi:hypothetical protein